MEIQPHFTGSVVESINVGESISRFTVPGF